MSDASVASYDPITNDKDTSSSVLATSDEAAPKTQIIAIYGKGGIGKSFTLANLSYMMATRKKDLTYRLRSQE